MALTLLKEMRAAGGSGGGIKKLSCASPATTAVCSSIDRRAIVQPRPPSASHRPSRARRSGVAITDLIATPPGSSRYLLTADVPAAQHEDSRPVTLTDADCAVPEAAVASSKRTVGGGGGAVAAAASEIVAVTTSSETAHHPQPNNQVVVLRVSLHCKGCAGKLRKHLSKMEGVTSFDIDLATKKVTVVGDVTPLSVLNSISKVKNAQMWPSAAATNHQAI